MTTLEANKIIAEYMGADLPVCNIMWSDITNARPTYSLIYNSLDKLVPVWEKLNQQKSFNLIVKLDIKHAKAFLTGTNGVGCGYNIQDAAAMATARTIQELEK